MITATKTIRSRFARVGKFGIVGLLNTLLDFLIFNVLFGVFGFWVILANIVSSTVAMVFSFLANRHIVFKAQGGSRIRQAVLFLIVTAFGLYVLQLGVIHLLTSIWTAPLTLIVQIVHHVLGANTLSDRFIRNNAAKVFGTVISLCWNYVMYKRVVFST